MKQSSSDIKVIFQFWDGVVKKPLDIHCIGLVLVSLAGINISVSFDKNDSKEVKEAKVMRRNKNVVNNIFTI